MSEPALPPETRLSLLARLHDPADEEAWNEFVGLYTPVIYRTALIIGLQDADALEIVQQVLVSVAKTIAERPHDPERAKFRTWLSVVTRNKTISLLRSQKNNRGSGDSEHHRQLQALEDVSAESAESILDREYQQELFRKVAKEIEAEFSSDTWRAFWLTTVDQLEISEVAKELGKQVGSIYAARSRVMRRLRERVAEWQSEESDS